jgi:hypothetical protein
MTRQEHLDWCKKRALEYVDIGDNSQAMTSMFSDLRKHEETEGHAGIGLGMAMIMEGHLNNAHEVRKFIEGFN